MIVGCYEIHLYCETCNTRDEFTSDYDKGLQQCKQKAKAAGWQLIRDEFAYCPKHHIKK